MPGLFHEPEQSYHDMKMMERGGGLPRGDGVPCKNDAIVVASRSGHAWPRPAHGMHGFSRSVGAPSELGCAQDHENARSKRRKGGLPPFVYAVTDRNGVIRYFDKGISDTPLRSRWLRHDTIHHQESARNRYIEELDEGRGPLAVGSVSIAEFRDRLPPSFRLLPAEAIATGLEALWIQRWRAQLSWNDRNERPLAGFDDGDYWR